MCLYPKLIQNRKYIANKKNGGVIPAVYDKRVLAVPVGCGRCMECMKKKSREWQARMLEDIKHNRNGIMVTLTFSDQSINELKKEIDNWQEEGYKESGYELDNAIAKLAVRRFNERWRKKHKKAIRHWLVTELGHQGTENIHLHGIVWTDEHKSKIEKYWQYGYVYTGEWVNEQTVNYTIKYIHKLDEDHKEYKPKILTSAGIGGGYLKRTDYKSNKYKEEGTKEYFKTKSGHKIALPIYWRNKIYSEEEREKLWIEKLDKKTRYINGIQIDISEGEEIYYQVLEQERQKNIRLGYQTNQIDWNRKKYEEERRNLLMQERIERAEKSLRGPGDAPGSAESVNDFASLSKWHKTDDEEQRE